MFTLLHGFYKYLKQKDEYCVLILGLDNAGKTVCSNENQIQINSVKHIFVVVYHLDISGGSKNQIYKKLPWHKSEQNNNNCWLKHWTNWLEWHQVKFLGSWWTARTAIAVGQILSRISRHHLCHWFERQGPYGGVQRSIR